MFQIPNPVVFLLILTTMSLKEGHCFPNKNGLLNVNIRVFEDDFAKPHVNISDELEDSVNELTEISANYIKEAQKISELPPAERTLASKIFEEIFKADFEQMNKIALQLHQQSDIGVGEVLINRIEGLLNCFNELPHIIHCIIFECAESITGLSCPLPLPDEIEESGSRSSEEVSDSWY